MIINIKMKYPQNHNFFQIGNPLLIMIYSMFSNNNQLNKEPQILKNISLSLFQ